MNLDSIEVPTKPPSILYLDPGEGPYRHGYRLLGRGKKGDLLVFGGKGEEVERVWVCFDLSNGNPEMLLGRVYVWIFKESTDALNKLQVHENNPDYAQLKGPYPYALVRGKSHA